MTRFAVFDLASLPYPGVVQTLDIETIVNQWFDERVRNSAVTRAGVAAINCITAAVEDEADLLAEAGADLYGIRQDTALNTGTYGRGHGTAAVELRWPFPMSAFSVASGIILAAPA